MKVAVIGLGNHGKKYLNFFKRKNVELFGFCKTEKTKNYIENNYNVKVFLGYKELIKINNFAFIVLALPSDIQGKVALDIVKNVSKSTNILIELPVSDFHDDRKALENFENIGFFIEEYYSLLANFLRKINISKIEKVDVDMYVSQEDFGDEKSENINKIHLMNNFIGLNINYDIFDIKVFKHDNLNVYFDISFNYLGKQIKYSFFKEKFLIVGNKRFKDNFNFDDVITNLINNFYPVSDSKKDFNRLFNKIKIT